MMDVGMTEPPSLLPGPGLTSQTACSLAASLWQLACQPPWAPPMVSQAGDPLQQPQPLLQPQSALLVPGQLCRLQHQPVVTISALAVWSWASSLTSLNSLALHLIEAMMVILLK